jgi:hypothetical protein
MEEEESKLPESTAMMVTEEEAENPAEEFDIKELEQLDEILGKSASGQVKMLDFERQMFLDCVYNDGLVICGK